jgi:hypothetical protein
MYGQPIGPLSGVTDVPKYIAAVIEMPTPPDTMLITHRRPPQTLIFDMQFFSRVGLLLQRDSLRAHAFLHNILLHFADANNEYDPIMNSVKQSRPLCSVIKRELQRILSLTEVKVNGVFLGRCATPADLVACNRLLSLSAPVAFQLLDGAVAIRGGFSGGNGRTSLRAH